MKLYHGTTYNKAEAIIDSGKYDQGYDDNPWSGTLDEGGLFCSNVIEYAEQYGSVIVEITVDDSSVEFIQDCPLDENDFGWKPEFKNAAEYLVPSGVTFTARIA